MFSLLSQAQVALLCGSLLLFAPQAEAKMPWCPKTPSLQGFSTWEQLKQSDLLDVGGTVVLCPGTVFYATSGTITLYGAFLTIQCGPDGRLSDHCVIDGGARHFDVVGEGVKLQGLTLRYSLSGSVSVQTAGVDGEAPAESIFEDCLFERNDSTSMGFTGAAVNVHAGGSVRFQGVSFFQNVAYSGAVSIDEGQATFDECIFEMNISRGEALKLGGAGIYVYGRSGSIAISNSCFLQNQGPAASVFLRSNGPTVQFNGNNYGEGNTNTVFECGGIFDDQDGTCRNFDADHCGPTRPSASPSISAFPSYSPSATPSATPSTSPSVSNQPSDSPSLVPSHVPSSLPSSHSPSSSPSFSPSVGPTSLVDIFFNGEIELKVAKNANQESHNIISPQEQQSGASTVKISISLLLSVGTFLQFMA